MTKVELVEFINWQRKDGEDEHRHDHFMAKVPKVLGDAAPNFQGSYSGRDGTARPCYTFPKREACLMAMSYSYLALELSDSNSAANLKAPLTPPCPEPTVEETGSGRSPGTLKVRKPPFVMRW